MSALFQIRVVPTFEDYLRFNAYHGMRRLRPVAMFPAIWLVVAVMCYAMGGASEALVVGTFLIVGLAAALIVASVYVSSSRNWQHLAELHEPRMYRFTDEGLQVDADTFNGFVRWEHIYTAETTGELILLGTGQPAYHLLPKTAFSDEQTVEQFIAFLREKVQDTQRLK